MKKSLYVLQVFIFSLLLISCSSEDNQAQTPTEQGAKTELFAVGSTRIARASVSASSSYLFTLDNIKSFNVQTREIVFQDFEPTNKLFPIYRQIEVRSYDKVLLRIATFVSSFDSQIFTDLSLVSETESGKFYLSDCYPRHIENDSKYAKANEAIKEAKDKRAAEWSAFLSILKKHGKLIE